MWRILQDVHQCTMHGRWIPIYSHLKQQKSFSLSLTVRPRISLTFHSFAFVLLINKFTSITINCGHPKCRPCRPQTTVQLMQTEYFFLILIFDYWILLFLSRVGGVSMHKNYLGQQDMTDTSCFTAILIALLLKHSPGICNFVDATSKSYFTILCAKAYYFSDKAVIQQHFCKCHRSTSFYVIVCQI